MFKAIENMVALRVQVPNYHILSKIVACTTTIYSKPEYLIIGSSGPLGWDSASRVVAGRRLLGPRVPAVFCAGSGLLAKYCRSLNHYQYHCLWFLLYLYYKGAQNPIKILKVPKP